MTVTDTGVPPEIVEMFFEESDDALGRFEDALLRLERDPDDVESLHLAFRLAHSFKGSSAMMGFRGISTFTHDVEALLDRVRDGRSAVTPEVIDALLGARDALRDLLECARRGVAVDPATAQAAATTSGRLVALARPLAEAPTPSAVAPETTAVPGGGESASESTPREARDVASVRVPTARIDGLVDLAGELVTTQLMLVQALAELGRERHERLVDALAQMGRQVHDLHDRVMACRMVPLATTFARFPRVVRDAAAAAEKQVSFEIAGEETELDRTVVEKIADPLLHLLRNAVDHGLESPGARLAAGKPAIGRVRLEAWRQGGSVHIAVADDGRGLDRERILARATATGLVAAGHASTDDEVFALVFRPGLSTAARVTELSGRGVGMDVVKRDVEALGGTVAIESEAGRGTRVAIRLPLTIAMLEGQLIGVSGQVYVLPIGEIAESVKPGRDAIRRIAGTGEVVLVRGAALPLLRLRRVLRVPCASNVEPETGLVVVVEHRGQRVGLLVDELLAQHQVVIKSLDACFAPVPGVSAATILGDGRVALILDVPGLLAAASRHHRSAAPARKDSTCAG